MRDGATDRTRPERISIVMIVREGAERKEMPEIVMAELQPRAAFQISSEQSERLLRLARQILEQFADARQHSPIALWQFLRKKRDVAVEKRVDVLRRCWSSMFLENLAGDRSIGPARDFHVAEVAIAAKPLNRRANKRVFSGRAGIHEGHIDIPKNEAPLFHKRSAPFPVMLSLSKHL